jgi:ADP-ribosylglycohydrolase
VSLGQKPSLFKSKQDNMKIFVELMEKAIDLSKKDLPDTKAIRQLGEGWTAEEALAIAVYSCLKYSNSFQDAIVCAVNHDGDSDSTGAIAGNLVGAALGIQNIPKYYGDNVELKDVIVEVADDLYLATTDNSVMNTEPWIKKYIDCVNNCD